jgi:hypothetical protein
VKKEEREFWYLFLQIKRETPRTHPRLGVISKNKHWWSRD